MRFCCKQFFQQSSKMKIRFNLLAKTVLVPLLWLACIYKIYIDYDYEYLMDSLIHTGLIILATIISAFAIHSDYSQYKQNKNVTSFISSATILLFITGLLLTTYLLKKQDDTPSILYAIKNTSGFGSITLDFRENNTYKLGQHHFMSTGYSRGHYSKKDSIIYLNDGAALEELTSNRLVLKTIPVSDSVKNKKQTLLLTLVFGKPQVDTAPETFLFQVDKKGGIMESATSFKVVQKVFN
jgi:hypothetical protein